MKLAGQRKAERLVGLRSSDRIIEVVCVSVLLVAKVEPGVRILMSEERIVSADVGVSLKTDGWAREGVPGTCRDWKSRRANGEQVNHHQFAVSVPPGGQEAALRSPPHRECGAAIEHPWPVHALVDLRGQVLDLRILEILPAGKHTAQQDG